MVYLSRTSLQSSVTQTNGRCSKCVGKDDTCPGLNEFAMELEHFLRRNKEPVFRRHAQLQAARLVVGTGRAVGYQDFSGGESLKESGFCHKRLSLSDSKVDQTGSIGTNPARGALAHPQEMIADFSLNGKLHFSSGSAEKVPTLSRSRPSRPRVPHCPASPRIWEGIILKKGSGAGEREVESWKTHVPGPYRGLRGSSWAGQIQCFSAPCGGPTIDFSV